MITRAQRKAIREAGPFSIIHGYLRRTAGGASTTGIDDATGETSIAALNAIVEEPESVAVAREKLCKAAANAGTIQKVLDAADEYSEALRAAKKTRKT